MSLLTQNIHLVTRVEIGAEQYEKAHGGYVTRIITIHFVDHHGTPQRVEQTLFSRFGFTEIPVENAQ